MVDLLVGLQDGLRVLPATKFAQVLQRSVLQRRRECSPQTVPPETGFVRDTRQSLRLSPLLFKRVASAVARGSIAIAAAAASDATRRLAK